jgi:hypothetical protein
VQRCGPVATLHPFGRLIWPKNGLIGQVKPPERMTPWRGRAACYRLGLLAALPLMIVCTKYLQKNNT